MSIQLMGSSGIGFMWGWILGNMFASSIRSQIRNCLIYGIGTVLLSIQVYLLNDWALLAFFITVAFSILIQKLWLRLLGAFNTDLYKEE